MSQHSHFELEYTQINENFRFLAEIRFKLLALVPALGGAGIFVHTNAGLDASQPAASSDYRLAVVLFVSLIGFLATLGITLYDQRNSELYNALIHRAKWLESKFDVSSAPGGLRESEYGGQFSERPRKSRWLIFHAGHDLALALIYGPVLGAWLLPAIYAGLLLARVENVWALFTATAAAMVGGAIFSGWLVVLDRQEMKRYRQEMERYKLAAGKSDSNTSPS
jgi:hypothetical protein